MMCSMKFLPSSYWDLPLNLSLEAQGRVPGFRQHGMDQNEVMTTWDQPLRRHGGCDAMKGTRAGIIELHVSWKIQLLAGCLFIFWIVLMGKKALAIVESLLRYSDCERGTKSNPKFRGLNPRPALANAGHASRTNPGLSNCVYTTCSNLWLKTRFSPERISEYMSDKMSNRMSCQNEYSYCKYLYIDTYIK